MREIERFIMTSIKSPIEFIDNRYVEKGKR